MAIAHIAGSNSYSSLWESGVPLSGVMPVGTLEGDVMIASIARADNGTISTLSGWTSIEQVSISSQIAGLFWKVAGASETGPYAWETTEGVVRKGSVCISSFSGVDTSDPFDVAYVRATHHTGYTTDDTPTPNAITHGANVFVLVTIVYNDGTAQTCNAPTSYTKSVQCDKFADTGGRGNAIHYRSIASSGTETPADVTFSAAGIISSGVFTLALQEVATDVTAPILTAPSTTNATATTIDLTATTDTTEGEATAVITTSATAPSVAQVLAGTDDSDVAATWTNVGSEVTITTTSIVIPASLTLVPGATYYGYIVHEDVALNASLVAETGAFTLEALPVSEIYLGGTITDQSILHYLNATAASGSATTAVVTGAGWTTNEWAGLTLVKDSDSSKGVVASNTADTITYTGAADMTGGGLFDIVATLETNDVMWAESPVTVTSESVDIDYYVQDVSTTPDEWGAVTTQTINGLTGTPDGSYDVSLDAVGVITLTPVSAAFGIIQDLTRDLTQDLTRDIAG